MESGPIISSQLDINPQLVGEAAKKVLILIAVPLRPCPAVGIFLAGPLPPPPLNGTAFKKIIFLCGFPRVLHANFDLWLVTKTFFYFTLATLH